MPHIIIEHSQSTAGEIDLNKLANSLHQELSEKETISLSNIKTRCHLAKNVIIGENSSKKFLHITVKLLSGRSEELKKEIADSLFEKIEKFTKNNSYVSVEVVDLQTYRKL